MRNKKGLIILLVLISVLLLSGVVSGQKEKVVSLPFGIHQD